MAYQIDRSKCLCCHNCALECPVGAIDYVGTGYQVDEERCVSCGHCAKVCNVAAPYEVGKTVTVTPHARRELEADLVVLGAGASGIVAAAKAASLTGKKVIVLEKAAKFGGSGWFAGFMVPAEGSSSAKPPMFAMAQKALRDGGIDPKLMENADRKPTEFFQWFRTMDPRVDEFWAPVPGPGGMTMDLPERKLFNLKNTDKAIGPGRSTSVMEAILVDHFQELGIQLLTNHRAVSIEKDESGAVCGVLAQDPGGEVHIACKAIISCTGGFANNEAMLRKYAPQYYGPEGSEPTHRFAAPTNTGDVMALGASAGAYLDEDNFCANVFGPVHHPFSFSLFCCANQPEVVTVNKNGKRFIDESIFGGGAAAMYSQPGRVAWSILDEQTKQELCARLQHGPDAAVMQNIEGDFQAEAALGTPLKVANTLEELADLIEVDKDAFLATIANYNAACAAGQDPEFGKRPETMKPVKTGPFYAIFGKIACDGAFGGMLVNGDGEVYNREKSAVIPGLFAAGDNASGWLLKPTESGDHRLMVTNECNWAIGSGYTAAESAAAYLTRV